MFLSAKEREALPRFLLPANRRLKVIVGAPLNDICQEYVNKRHNSELVRELRMTLIMRICENDIYKGNWEWLMYQKN